jgi:hypothetical protein
MSFNRQRETQPLNAICPYFTMFPLDFPLGILERSARAGDTVLDPFCGRGTTNFAARLLGLYSVGVDSSPVAVAITAAKLVSPTVGDIVAEARRILAERQVHHIPTGEFWQWAFHPMVLDALCRFREAFLEDCTSPARVALRGIILGALHGPKQKTFPSYFSNQCPRTYAPKPAYALRFWQKHGLVPELVDVLAVIERRAARYYGAPLATGGVARLADSRKSGQLALDTPKGRYAWVITSPPYYGMRTYIPDQWLRNWFIGGPDTVDYSAHEQLVHSSPEEFAADLRLVWRNATRVCRTDAKLVVRFGGIASNHTEPLTILRRSFEDSGWRITTVRDAGMATNGRRQAHTFLREKTRPLVEYDVWAVRQ